MPYLIILTILMILGVFLITSLHDAELKTELAKIKEEIVNGDLRKRSLLTYIKFPSLNKKIIGLISETAAKDAYKGNYDNSFENEFYSNRYKEEYKKVRKNYIEKTAHLDFLRGIVTSRFDKDPVELKMYQESYLKHKSASELEETVSVWGNVGEAPIPREKFEEMFVKDNGNDKQKYRFNN